jgi:hypothetical protein
MADKKVVFHEGEDFSFAKMAENEVSSPVERYFLNTITWEDGDQLLLSISGRWLDKLVDAPDDGLDSTILERFGHEVRQAVKGADATHSLSLPVHVSVYDDHLMTDDHKLCISGSWVEGLLREEDSELTPAAKALIQDFADKVRALVG